MNTNTKEAPMFDFRPDSNGDVWCRDFNRYMKNDSDHVILSLDTLNQLAKNYESSFGEPATAEKLKSAISFISTFCAEIGETAPTSWAARAAGEINGLIDEADALQTAENIADIRTHYNGKRIKY
jgi:hypothetical protein